MKEDTPGQKLSTEIFQGSFKLFVHVCGYPL